MSTIAAVAPSGADTSIARARASRTLEDCFALFALIHKTVTSSAAVRRITLEVLDDFAADNVKYLELRTTPRPLADCDMEGYVRTVLSAFAHFEAAEAARSTWPMLPRLLLSVDRSKGVDEAQEVVRLAARLRAEGSEGGTRKYVVGVDFSGNPLRGSFAEFADAFEEARRSGLKVAAHCGEVDTPEETSAILAFAPDRLGHALHLTPPQFEALAELRIPIEICPTSNMKTLHLHSLRDHPTLSRWLARGYPISINTDDTGVFSTDASAELFAACCACELSAAQAAALTVAPLDHCFEPEACARQLRERIAAEAARLAAAHNCGSWCHLSDLLGNLLFAANRS